MKIILKEKNGMISRKKISKEDEFWAEICYIVNFNPLPELRKRYPNFFISVEK